MFHNSKTKGHGSIRKNKVYGTIGILTLGTIAILSAHQGVAADEVKATKPTTPAPVAEASDTSLAAQSKAAATEAASSSTAAITTAKAETTAPAGATSTADTTTASATTTTESAATQPATAPVASTTPAATTATPETTPAPATTAKAEATTPAPAGAVSTSDPVATPVDRTEGSKVTVENQKLKDAISEANGYNIDVKQNQNDNIGTANNQVESDAKKDLANTLEETQATRIKTGVDAYKRDLKKAQANTGTPGYLSEVVSQGLKFEREPNAKLSITGTTEFGQKDMNNMSYEEYVKSGGTFANNPIPAFTTKLSAGGSRFVIPKIKSGQTITATYTGLQNSKYNGVSISKVTYEVTNLNPKTGIVGFAEKDPTRGIYTFYDINVPSRYKVVARFYDADGNVINFKKDNPAILALTSLTKTEPKTGKLAGLKHEESITDYNFRPVKITGSLVEKQTDGRLAANIVTDGIKDDYDDPNFYKMGIAGVAESGDSISFVMQRTTQWDRGYWLAITSKLPSRFTLVKPDLEYNLVEYNLAGNVLLDNYIQGTTTKLTNTQTVKPTGTPVGEDYTTTHQDRITTADGKIYKYVSSTNNTTGKVKLGTTNVANYYAEVKGNVVVDYQDKQGNTISPRIVDTPDTSVGTAYDTTDHKPSTITTADGVSYRIDPTATQGKESGRVVEGTTRVIYVYDKLEKPVEKYGNVVVDYQDKQGNTISPRIVDTPTSRVGTYYDTTDHKPTTITTDDGTTYRIDTNATQGHESGQVVEGTTRVVYVYDKVEKPVEKYGNVVVDYQDKQGNTIAERVVDTPTSKVGTAYDTTDHKPATITTADGTTYRIDRSATKGKESGQVVEGTTQVVYVYDKVEKPVEKYGNVVVDYQDKQGNTIAERVVDTPTSKVGTAYDTTDHKPATITTADGTTYRIDRSATKGKESGQVVEGTTQVVYVYDKVEKPVEKYGNVVVDYQDKQGNTIAERVVDTPTSKVGTAYDTTDHKPATITTADGTTYRIDRSATKGKESGQVVEGTTQVVYVYDKVEKPAEEYGNVVVDYQDKKGNTIAPRVVDTPDSKVGTNYDTTDHKPTRITTADGKVYRIDPKATQGQESGKIVKGTTRVVYVYDEVLGDVTVHYKDEDGKVIKEPEKDTTGAPINTVYDTRDHAHKTITTKDGRTYEIVPEKTQGLEQGRVVEGNTDVTYIYKQVFGDVVVHYEDESGKKIKEDVTDTSHAKVGENYDTTDHKTTAIKSGDKVYNLVPEKTKGNEKGKVTKGVTEVTYVYKEVKAEPTKKGTNAKGEDVNGKTMLAGSTEIYTINIDNDQYKGLTGVTEKDKQAGLMLVEKYSGKYVTPNLAGVRVTTEDGKVQSGFTTKIYKSLAEAPQKVQDYIKAKGLQIDGEFAVTTSDDPVAYTNNYVLKGINLKLIFPTTVKKDIKDASKYDNKAYQIDFTGIHDTNLVTNNIPKINPKKDVVATVEDGQKDQNSLSGKTVKVGQVYNFELETSYLPANRGQAIEKMEVKDTYSPLVEYNGVHKWFAKTDLLLKDGTRLAKGTDLTQYVSQTIDHKSRTVVYSFSSDFLSKISDNSEFQATGYMQVKQLNTGTVKNTFTEIINNVERDSNTVTVDSPQDYGDVVVHYVDESGKKIKEDVTDTSHSKVGENYDTTDHKTTAIKSGDKVYNLVPEKTKGNEKGKVTKGVTEVTYVYKEVKAEPTKKGTNAKGEDVNGKTMLAGSTEIYTINIDNDQYKGLTGVTEKDKQAGLMLVEKYSGKYVTPNLAGVRVTTEDGKVQSGFTTKIYKSLAEAPQKVQDYIKAKGLQIDGEFAVTTSDDPVAYTNNYVLKGINLKLIFPTTVKKDIKDASKYDNKAYQIDFTGIHDTNLVTNNIPKINPKKDVVATVEDGQKDQNSLSGKTVKVGQVYNFELETSYLPANRGQAIEKMEVKDTYSSLVEYNGVHKWFAKTDILLKNGQKIAKGTDLTKFVNQTVDHKTRTVVYSFSSAFLNSISDNSEFQATGYMQVKQLDYGTVKNTFTEIINGVERNSNTVTVVTPDKPKTPDKPQTPPETPKTPEKPQTPPTPTPTPVVPTTPKQPVTPQVTLPSTGEATNDGAALVGLAFAATALSMLGFKKRKEEE
ncbi:putative muramidase-released protein [Streptococcus milleri]|uniref:SspB-related isopeptide-forming adhesin n=1 Tax=Streptococcus milleri TaxID=33040 RepID=UPI000F6F6488|nr:SspB-related isopeptide-forming adhesin [Streptococcus milleri]VEE11092.1 putative muramidase-released protein [Streptococcus milleri]